MAKNRKPKPAKTNFGSQVLSNLRKLGHLIRTNWQAYLLEIIVVIIGITISFSLNNLKEKNDRKKLELAYQVSLLNDIHADTEELERVIDETRQVIEKATRVISIVEENKLQRINTPEFLEDIRGVLGRPAFISKDITFSDMKSSGNIQLIRDMKLKNLIFEYYRVYEIIKMNEFAEREATITITGPYFFKRFPFQSTSAGRLNIKSIAGDIEFGNNLQLRLANRQELLNSYLAALKLATELRDELERRTK